MSAITYVLILSSSVKKAAGREDSDFDNACKGLSPTIHSARNRLIVKNEPDSEFQSCPDKYK